MTRPAAIRGGSLALGLAALAACRREPPPERVRLELPELVTNHAAVRPLVRATHGVTTTTLAPEAYTLGSRAPAVAAPTGDGAVACKKTGDATITASVQGIEGSAPLHCRLVARLEVGDVPGFDLTKAPPPPLGVRAFSADGKELSDVPILISTTNRQPLRVDGRSLVPVAVGTTDVIVRAGEVEHRFATRVVRTLSPEIAALRGGKRLEVALPPGKYEIEVTLETPHPLRMDFRGARQCAYSGTGTIHRLTCALEAKGSVVVDNPAFVERGETTLDRDRVAVREVP